MGETHYVKQTVDEIIRKKTEDPDGPQEDYNYEGFVYEDNDSWVGVWPVSRAKNAQN